MLNDALAARKVAIAMSRLKDTDDLLVSRREEFVADYQRRDLASFYLMLAIQECIDLTCNWIASIGWEPPSDAGSAFGILASHGAITREQASALCLANDWRKRIVHGEYAEADSERLYDEYLDGSRMLKKFLAVVASRAGL